MDTNEDTLERWTMHILNSRNRRGKLPVRAAVVCIILFSSFVLMGQSTPGTGAIRGIVTTPTGDGIPGAQVTIVRKATNAVTHAVTSSTGDYSSGPLLPGDYSVRIEANGFKTAEFAANVHVAIISSGDVKLPMGKRTEVVNLPEAQTYVNNQQPTLQTLLPEHLIETLPINGRNYLNLAQLTPGVQLQDAGVVDPSKLGASAASTNSQWGRTVRLEVDGVDESDEVAGTMAQNLAASAIQEFSVSRSTLDLPSELTGAGTVNVTTRSGENELHGELFGLYRPNDLQAKLPASPVQSFQRQQYGGRVGGALIKNKLFWFLAGERAQQHLTASEPFAFPFNGLNDMLSRPFRELQADGRIDWQRHDNAHGFYRFTFDQVSQIGPFGAASSLQGLREATRAPSHALGYDFTQGRYTHSFRFEYLRMSNGVGDDTFTLPAGVNNPIPGLGISLGSPVQGNCALSGGTGLYCGGPSPFANQAIIQTSYEARYDGSRVLAEHLFRYGVVFDRIHAGGFQASYLDPQVSTTTPCLPGSTMVDCLSSPDPTAYPAESVFLGNGIGFSTTQSAFGFRGGGLGPDNRIETYLGDNWRIKRNVMLTYGLRYSHETGRVDSSLGGLDALNKWLPGLSNPVRNPKTDFGPQFGFAWDVGTTGKTVVRGGGGVYYESSLWNNMMLDSRARSPRGMLTYTPQVCAFGVPSPFTWPTSLASATAGSPLAGGAARVVNPTANQVEPTFCGNTIFAAASPIMALSNAFQAAAASPGSQGNPNFTGTTLNASYANGIALFNPRFLTPRVIQANLGFQTEIRPGMVFSMDYVRAIGEHNLLILDQNHSGAARSFNYNNAFNARNAAQIAAGCPPLMGEAQCMVSHLGSVAAAQAAYSAAGLDSNSATAGGGPCPFCAFPGITPLGINFAGTGGGTGALGTLDTMSTVGRSVYDGGQVKVVERVAQPISGVRTANLEIAYSYTKFESQAGDTGFAAVAVNNDRPLEFTGPNGMDRKHQLSFGGTFELPLNARVSFFGHIYSPLAQTMQLPQMTNGGEILATDWLGSGLSSGGGPEPLPGTGAGEFMRSINMTNLQQVIDNYNTHFAGTLTPSGHCLVADTGCPGTAPVPLMTMTDMNALGWVLPTLASMPPDAGGTMWVKTFDVRASWPFTFKDRFVIEPSVSVFNVINFANGFMPGNLGSSSMYFGPNITQKPNGILAPNALGGIQGSGLAPFRASMQSGTFAMGAPRQIEFNLRFSF
jgi:hypothetical protein